MNVRAWLRVVAGAVLLLLASAEPAAAHSQLVSSIPGSGEVVATSPPRAQLVFSEPVDPAYSGFDLLDSQGKVLASGLGTPDTDDPRSLVAALPHLDSGAYTIAWHALSATDGHATQGFIVFAVGDASLPPGAGVGTPGGVGDIHAGHGGNQALIEALARSLADAGFMAAFGLAVVYLAVRGAGSVSMASIAWAACAGLILAAAGSLLLGVSSASNSGDSNLIDYLTDARSGQLLLARVGIAAAGAAVVAVLARIGDSRSIPVACAAGLAGLVLIAAGGHAAAFPSFVPLAIGLVHVASGAVWVGGLFFLALVTIGRTARQPDLAAIVPRFSALALVSVSLAVLCGLLLDLIQTGDLVSLATAYQQLLVIKMGVVLAALGIGAVNYLRGAADQGRRLSFDRRIVAESGLAVVIIILSANLASGSPPGALKPVPIAQATSSALDVNDMSMSLLPGRAGPNEVIVGDIAVPEGDTMTLVLTRLDQDQGVARVPLSKVPTGGYAATGIALPEGSHWDATIVLADASAVEQGRARFVFAVDAAGVTEGRALPAIDPFLAIALLLLIGGIGALAASGLALRLPRTDRRTGRVAMLIGGAVATGLGIAIVLGGVTR